MLDLQDLEERRRIFQNIFQLHPDGPMGLALIADALGVNERDPSRIKPELIVFWNWLKYQIGITHRENIVEEFAALLSIANDNDIVQTKLKSEERKNVE